MKKKLSKEIDLNRIPQEELLDLKLSDLPVTIEGTWLEGCIQQLYKELEDKGLTFKPSCYLADEWLAPQGETVIGIPFYLAHPVLIALEKTMMLEAEGETPPWCMKLLRHETGHAIGYAYNLHKQKKWQKLFGDSAKEYPDTYRFRPYSKNYVRHLENYYAQYHPDEDFVETFAVWLTPGLDWRKQYQGWKALEKLNYIDEIMIKIRGKDPLIRSQNKFWRLSTLRMTLRSFYKRKRNFWAEDLPDFHDVNLRKIFMPFNAEAGTQPFEITGCRAAGFVLEEYRDYFLTSISRWTGEKKYIVDDILKKILKRCAQLRLVTSEAEPVVVLRVAAYLTTLVMNYQYTGWFRGKKRKP